MHSCIMGCGNVGRRGPRRPAPSATLAPNSPSQGRPDSLLQAPLPPTVRIERPSNLSSRNRSMDIYRRTIVSALTASLLAAPLLISTAWAQDGDVAKKYQQVVDRAI